MLKEGHKHLSGLDEAVLKNIDACKQLSTITRTSLGPNGTTTQLNHSDLSSFANNILILLSRFELFLFFFFFLFLF